MMAARTDPKDNKVVDPNWGQQNAAYAPYMQNPYDLMPDEPIARPTNVAVMPTREELMQDMRNAIAQEVQARLGQGGVTQPSPSTTSTQPTLS